MISVQLKPGKYGLSRIEPNDGAGDSGPVLISRDPENDFKRKGEFGEIHVGCRIECGSITARSYSAQDYWLTSLVTEILSVNEDRTEVIFKTGNSKYKAVSF